MRGTILGAAAPHKCIAPMNDSCLAGGWQACTNQCPGSSCCLFVDGLLWVHGRNPVSDFVVVWLRVAVSNGKLLMGISPKQKSWRGSGLGATHLSSGVQADSACGGHD